MHALLDAFHNAFQSIQSQIALLLVMQYDAGDERLAREHAIYLHTVLFSMVLGGYHVEDAYEQLCPAQFSCARILVD